MKRGKSGSVSTEMYVKTEVADEVIGREGARLEAVKRVSQCTVLVELVGIRPMPMARYMLFLAVVSGSRAKYFERTEEAVGILMKAAKEAGRQQAMSR